MSDKFSKCGECFYHFKEHNAFPCNACERYSHYIHKDVYTEAQPNEVWKRVVNGLNGTSSDDWPDFKDSHDAVNKPKHYMLFSEEDVRGFFADNKGIEVRDVIEKLVNKIREGSNVPFWKKCPLFEADYVQMMQYLMRFMDKGGLEDLKKAMWYLDKLIKAYEDA